MPRGRLVHYAASIMNASSTFIALTSRHESSLPTRTTVSLGGSQTLNILYNVCAPNKLKIDATWSPLAQRILGYFRWYDSLSS